MKPNYKNSILNVSTTFLKHYGIKSNYPSIKILEDELSNGYNHIIYILLDGMGVSTVNNHLSKDDALRKYMNNEVTSVFPPTTVAATTAVLSGLPPISNGHIGWVQYFKKEDTNLIIFLNKDYYTDQTQEEDLKEKYLGFKNILTQISEANQDVNCKIYFPDFIQGGSKSFSEEVEKVLITTHNTDKSFNYLYWTEPDISTHIHGSKSKEVNRVIKKLNSDFEELIENVTNDTLVVVIADHGLTDIEEIPFYEYQELTSLLLRKPSVEPRTANFFIKEGKTELFKELFNKQFNNDYQLYTKTEFLDSGLLGSGEKHPMMDDFLGDFIAVATSNKMFIFNHSKGYKAHHAGLSSEEMMVPLIIYKNQGN